MTSLPARSNPWRRAAAVGLLLVALCGMLVYGGTITPDAGERHYPGNDEVAPEPGAYDGQRVALAGEVVGTDPLRVEVVSDTGASFTLTVQGATAEATEDDSISVFGTLRDEAIIDAERVTVREPWEVTYMYGVSFAAGLWVLARTLRRWRFDAERLAFVPRETPLSWSGRDA